MLAVSQTVLFIFLFTSENESDDALTEVNRIIPIQLHPKPAMGFANEYNVKDGTGDEQMVFMMQSILNFFFFFSFSGRPYFRIRDILNIKYVFQKD